jgi:uncharacterized protein (DUF3084 family)
MKNSKTELRQEINVLNDALYGLNEIIQTQKSNIKTVEAERHYYKELYEQYEAMYQTVTESRAKLFETHWGVL